MLDHAAGIDQVIPPVLVGVAIGVAGSLQLRVGEEVVEIDLIAGELAGVGIDGLEPFFTAEGEDHACQGQEDHERLYCDHGKVFFHGCIRI